MRAYQTGRSRVLSSISWAVAWGAAVLVAASLGGLYFLLAKHSLRVLLLLAVPLPLIAVAVLRQRSRFGAARRAGPGREKSHEEPQSSIIQRVWTHAEAVKALVYLRGIARSLRDEWLEWRRGQLQLRRMDARPGRRDRHALIKRAEAVREAELAEHHFHEALRELESIDVYCIDPAAGRALIPFRVDDDLAWFVFDLFAPEGLEGWRYQGDAMETRRPLPDCSASAWSIKWVP